MRSKHSYYVYILASKSKVLYVGVTNNISARMTQHKQKTVPGFTQKYNVDRLVYVEIFQDIRDAIAREKQIKGWLRVKKVELIESLNPGWNDLTEQL